MAALYRRNAEALGRVFPDVGEAGQRSGGSTDMGNVSLALPSIHPAIGINSLPAVNHQPEFTAHCITAAADHAIVDGALAMAWTAIDIATDSRSAAAFAEPCLSLMARHASLRQPGLPETLIVSLHESAVFRVVGLRALLDRGDRETGRADLLAHSQGRACFVLPTEER